MKIAKNNYPFDQTAVSIFDLKNCLIQVHHKLLIESVAQFVPYLLNLSDTVPSTTW